MYNQNNDPVLDLLLRLKNAKTKEEKEEILDEIQYLSYEDKKLLGEAVDNELNRRDNIN